MAPWRKRGARGAKTKSELILGDLVLAKVKGFPAWPAKISRPEDWDRTPDPKKYFVQFFGTAEIAFVAPADIQAFTSEAKSKLLARCQGKTVKYFTEAVKEICDAFKELQQKISGSLKDNTDRSSVGCDTASVDGLEDDYAPEVDLKAEIGPDGTNGGKETRELGDHHGSGLERCSQRQGGTDCRDVKPSISCNANDSFSPNMSAKRNNKQSIDGTHFPKKEVSSASSPYNRSCLKVEEVFTDNIGEDKVIGSEHSKVTTECLNTSQDSSSPLVVSVRANKRSDGGEKVLANGHKSEKMVTSAKKKKCEGDTEVHKSSSLVVLTSSKHDTIADIPESGEHARDDGIQREKIASGGTMKEVDLDVFSGKKSRRLQKDADGGSEEQAKHDLSGKKRRAQQGNGRQDLVTNEVSHPLKRSKDAVIALYATKIPLQGNRKSDSRSSNVIADSSELKCSTPRVRAENRSLSRAPTGSVGSNVPGDEDVLPPTKRRRRALEAMSDPTTTTSEDKAVKGSASLRNDVSCLDRVKSPVAQLHTKRRAVRLYDDEDDEGPKTPIHGASATKVHAPPHVNYENSIHDQPTISTSGAVRDAPSKDCLSSAKLLDEPLSSNPRQTVEKRAKRAIMAAKVSHSPGKSESEKVLSRAKPISISPKDSPLTGAAAKPLVEPSKANKPLVAGVSGSGIQKKVQPGSSKAPGLTPDGLNSSAQSQATIQRSKPTVSSGERQKIIPKSNAPMTDSALIVGNKRENHSVSCERLEAGGDDKTMSLVDSKIADSAFSMKHLIAAAQARRKQSHSLNLMHGHPGSVLGSSVDAPRSSPSPSSVVQPPLSVSSNLMQPNMPGYYSHTSLASPTSHGPQNFSDNQPDNEDFEERRVSSGHRPAGGSLSGDTEAAVARDAFEGMIETLSRTKESIGRATRLAIDCAKYGIANEVVELLISKLESELNLHRKVDLFFLVDSITQCSHSHKGIAGASYIPTVQAALPRLLAAAAPPGGAARENRRQCVKVLRLWLERKILPESLLRRYVEDIGVSNDDPSTGVFLRRPSRAERAVDDPIREMEGMFVDEYGSNATFQLPGLLSSHVFDEEEEEEEGEEQEEDLRTNSCKEAGEELPVAPTPGTEEQETCTVTPNDRRHCILEDVDGELEMEDVDGRPMLTNGSFEISSRSDRHRIFETAASSNNSTSFHPLTEPEGSPPLPLDSPPPTPPLPPSPPPPPPPPLSPSPPPPPPPPAQLHPPPLPPFVAQPLQPLPSLVSHQFHPPQSSIPPSSSPKLAYQPSSIPHEYCSTSSGNQLVQMTANTPHGGLHIDAAVRGSEEMFPQQYTTCFVPARPSSDYGHNELLYINPQASQPHQHLRPGNAPFAERPFNAAPPHPTPSSHNPYSNPAIQHHPQHLYPRPYAIPNTIPDVPKRYIADEQQWRMSSSDSQHGGWVSGARTPSCSGQPLAQEGYFRAHIERQPTNNVGFQSSASNTLPAGAPIPGHSVSQMPTRPDISALNCWRPA